MGNTKSFYFLVLSKESILSLLLLLLVVFVTCVQCRQIHSRPYTKLQSEKGG